MPDSQVMHPPLKLAAEGRKITESSEVVLNDGDTLRMGRSSSCDFAVSWDSHISREHAEFRYQQGRLCITCLPMARNPFRFQDHLVREAVICPGEFFIAGTTTFKLSVTTRPADVDTVEIPVVSEPLASWTKQTYSSEELQRIDFRNSEQQLQLLSSLPEIISASDSDAELGHNLCGVLLQAMPQADAVAVAQYSLEDLPDRIQSEQEFPKPLTMRVRTRDEFSGTFIPSRRIILDTLRGQESVLHIWRLEAESYQFTVSEGLGWALCAPVHGESSSGWCMYVSGSGSHTGGLHVSEKDLAADMRFTELVAQFIGSVRQVRLLQEQKSRLNSFFSPKVIDSLMVDRTHNDLEPAEREITVLFCDVRGFSEMAERRQNDLSGLLESVRTALGVMVDGILEHDGTIADFQGDAALGFWGWPVALEYGPIPACRAAIAIRDRFHQMSQQNTLLKGFSVGIGVAHGRAVAGKIGTTRQSKVGVFGTVVNQCARLESLTKQLGVSICVDGSTAEFVDRYFSTDEGCVRPLARLRPHGMSTAIDVYSLLTPQQADPVTARHIIKASTSVFHAIIEGRWSDAATAIADLPKDDGPARFLQKQMAACENMPPTGWTGAFSLAGK